MAVSLSQFHNVDIAFIQITNSVFGNLIFIFWFKAPAVSSGDSYGAPQADPISQDSYGAPQADPISQDSYGAPQADPISQDSYGAPQAASISSSSSGYRDAKVLPAPSTNVVGSNSVNQGSGQFTVNSIFNNFFPQFCYLTLICVFLYRQTVFLAVFVDLSAYFSL